MLAKKPALSSLCVPANHHYIIMEDFLKSVEASELLVPLEEMGFTTVPDLALCEPEDLVADLAVDATKAKRIIQKARDAAALETRKATIQQTWKAVQDSLSVDATKLFYQRLFDQYPAVKPLFADADMDAQAEKLYKTVSLAVDYLNDMESLVPVLQELGARVRVVFVVSVMTIMFNLTAVALKGLSLTSHI